MATDAKTGQPIFHGATRVGLRNVGSYQVSGIPWMTGSENLDHAKVHLVEFPYVTKRVLVQNTSTGSLDAGSTLAILVHFESGSGTTAVTDTGPAGAKAIAPTSDVIAGYHYLPVLASGSLDMNIKCTKLYISQFTGQPDKAYHVFAELTNIPAASMPQLTGSGITE